MNKTIIGIILVLLFASQAQAAPISEKQIVNKKMLESEYSYLGNIPDWLNLGDRIYLITYSDGTTEKILIRAKPLLDINTMRTPLQKATIIEGASSTLWQTAGQPVTLNFRVQGVDLPSVWTEPCTSGAGATRCSTHRFELADVTTGYMSVLITGSTLEYAKEYSYEGKHTIIIPAQAAGKRTYNLKEFVILDSGTWMAGTATLSSDNYFDVIWTQAEQAGTPTPQATPVPVYTSPNPDYTPPAKAVQVVVDSKPTGATVQSNGAAVGNTPIILTIFPDDGVRPIIISKTGYVTKYTSFSASTQSPFIVQLDVSKPTGTPATTTAVSNGGSSGCAQVLTTAYNPNTLETKEFSTPCNVPPSWVVGTPKPTYSVTATGTPAATSSVDITYGAGGSTTYRGVDVKLDSGVYYVGDIPHDSIAEAKKTIDEMIAAKEQKPSVLDSIPTYGWVILAIAALGGGYTVLTKKKSGKGKNKKGK